MNVMERITSVLQNKKRLVIVLAIINLIGVIGFVVMFSSSSGRQPISQNSSPTQIPLVTQGSQNGQQQTPPSGQNAASPFPVVATHAQVEGWSHTQEGNLDFQLPPDWTQQRTPTKDGESLIMQPTGTSPDAISPRFVVVTFNGQTLSQMEQSESLFIAMGFTKTITALGTIQAAQLHGTFPPANAQGIPEDKFVQETHLYFVKNNVGYQIKYTYPGKTSNDFYDRLYAAMLSTVVIR